ncbi:hypothetical protein, partial [Vibrio sp. F13]|uniref:hypothetical protein n=1 Tax=Vibrio sp. F13 TaxID=2070777 RepID=UPI0019D0E3C1
TIIIKNLPIKLYQPRNHKLTSIHCNTIKHQFNGSTVLLRASLATACGRAFGSTSFSASVEAIEGHNEDKKNASRIRGISENIFEH